MPEHQEHPLDSLILVFEALRQNTDATTECLLVTNALLQVVIEQRPELLERYHQIHDASLASGPEEGSAVRQARAVLRRLDDTLQELRRKRGH